MTLAMENGTIAYDRQVVIDNLSVEIPAGSFTAVLGPNGCGKSTFLRALARVVPLASGRVLLDSHPISALKSKQVARRVGLLPQSSIAPDGITVFDLVTRGRSPYQSWTQQWRATDDVAVHAALEATQLTSLASRRVDELSGGQRQRVWIAMLLAQETDILLLDEPTTYLDIAHQYDVMDLLRELNVAGKTIVAVLHDINQAARYASHFMVMRDGRVRAQGEPSQVLSSALITEVFGVRAEIFPDPITATPTVVPWDKRAEARAR